MCNKIAISELQNKILGGIIMNIYTLREKETGNKEVLNGKMFTIKTTPENKAVFIDVLTGDILWVTTEIKSKGSVEEQGQWGVRFETQNSVYSVVSVLGMLPTGIKHPTDVYAVRESNSQRPCDPDAGIAGLQKWSLGFSREITRDEFIGYMIYNRHRKVVDGALDKNGVPRPHSCITGEGKSWSYIWITPCKKL